MKPAYLFQILDLPIVDSFLYKHGETLNKVLFKKDIALYKEINVDQPLIEDTFRNPIYNFMFKQPFLVSKPSVAVIFFDKYLPAGLPALYNCNLLCREGLHLGPYRT